MRDEPDNDDELWQEEEIGSIIIHDGSDVPPSAQAVRITLDGRPRSALDWTANLEIAQKALAKGLRILWDLELGLFDELEFPLSTQHQFQTLSLAIKHFLENVWPLFRDQTLGLNLFHGPIPETAEAFDYLDMLATHVPEALNRFYTFDLKQVSSLAKQAHLVDKERYPHTHLIVKNALIPIEGWVWKGSWINPQSTQETTKGICLPTLDLAVNQYAEKLEAILLEQTLPFRLVSENLLTTQWDGLDEVVVIADTLSSEGRRKLKGFEAAGGVVTFV